MLRVTNLCAGYGKTDVLHGVSFEVKAGQCVSLIGANGAGKSTILDALCFALFGKAFRKINKPNLVNSINNADTVVEVEFTVGKKDYKIVRGIKPNVFEIYQNKILINQDAKSKDYQDFLEKSILKFNFKSFTQIVILGSASFVPFMQLTPADRRTILEELLDIQIFTSMNTIIKDRMASIKEEVNKNKYSMQLLGEQIKMQKQNIEEHKKQNEDEIQKKKDELKNSDDQLRKLTKDNILIQKHIDSLNKKIGDRKDRLEKKSKSLVQIEAKVENTIKKNKKELDFYESNDNCPSCKQNITLSWKEQQKSDIQNKLDEQTDGLKKITKEVEKVNKELSDISDILSNINLHNNEIIKNNSTITAINTYVTKLNTEIKELSENKGNITENNEKLKELKSKLSEQLVIQKDLTTDKHYHEYAASLLKDNGIKTKIIKQYLPVINKLVNKYLKAMDFFVNFNLNESFEETIKSRHRDDFAYENFSEGEKMRIDLALLFTWRQIAKMKNSTNTNLLILDEVFDSSLDTVGTDEFLKLIHEMGHDTNIFVISHKGDQLFDKFHSVIRFVKKNNFSKVEK